jgi:hypothetical protein
VLVVAAGRFFAAGVSRVVVEYLERLGCDVLLGPSGGVGGVGEDADHRVARLLAVQQRNVPVLLVAGGVVPDGDCDHGRCSRPAGMPSGSRGGGPENRQAADGQGLLDGEHDGSCGTRQFRVVTRVAGVACGRRAAS